MNRLYYGDNLDVLRRYIADECVDLIYLDPPFNSNASYNVLFAERDGTHAAAQIKAFEDTWVWDASAARAYEEVVEAGGRVAEAMRAFRTFLGQSNMMAYLAMMAPRLVELRRVLKATGSIYLHCDPTASHYLKMLMDGIFGPTRLRNEIVWKRSDAKGDAGQGAKHFGRCHDVLLFYCRDPEESTFNRLYTPFTHEYIEEFYRHTDPDGRRWKRDNLLGPGGAAKGNPAYELMGVTRHWRYSKERMAELVRAGRVVQMSPGAVPMYKRYLDEAKGVPLTDWWHDIKYIHGSSSERLGYPTQKPLSLLERIIQASSNTGDLVLDPFCGCGTAVTAAQKLGRRWIGIDITHLAIGLIRHRLRDAHGRSVEATYEVVGEPVSVPDAAELASSDPYQFQWWALGLVGARPTEQKKGGDKGIDGRLYFHDDKKGTTKQVILSVKAGHVSPAHLRDLLGVLDRERAQIGVLLCLEEPTRGMRKEAAAAGFYASVEWGTEKHNYPRLQILTIADLLEGKRIDMPAPRQTASSTFRKAPRAKGKKATTTRFDFAAPDESPEE